MTTIHETIAELRGLMEKSTHGPLTNDGCMVFSLHIPNGRSACVAPLVCSTDVSNRRYADADLIVSMRNNLPALLDRLDALEEFLSIVKKHRFSGTYEENMGEIDSAIDRLDGG